MEMEKAVNEIISSERFRKEVVRHFCDMLAIPAMAPENGGTGELSRARFLEGLLKDLGFEEVKRVDSSDARAEGGVRPNIIALPQKAGSKDLPITWLVTHMDTVPVNESEMNVWKSDPFKPEIRDGAIFARGASDNGQDLIATVFAVAAVKRALPELNLPIGIVLVADEETGSKHGIIHLIRNGNIFSKKRGDEVIVPDAGSDKGDLIETAEKGLLWMRVETKGKQAHGSRPDLGLNAQLIASRFQCELHGRLSKKFPARNRFFTSPVSTFEPTMRFPSVKNVNTIPGEDTFFMDCRILPDYRILDVLRYSRHLARKFSKSTGARITVSVHHVQQTSPKTSPESRTVVRLNKAIRSVLHHVKPHAGGIGGNTCAAFFRSAGFPAVVWGLKEGKAHAPNESARISDVMNSVQVYSQFYINASREGKTAGKQKKRD